MRRIPRVDEGEKEGGSERKPEEARADMMSPRKEDPYSSVDKPEKTLESRES